MNIAEIMLHLHSFNLEITPTVSEIKATLNSASEYEDGYYSKNWTMPSKYQEYGTKGQNKYECNFWNELNQLILKTQL